jgi:hypothetical protein
VCRVASLLEGTGPSARMTFHLLVDRSEGFGHHPIDLGCDHFEHLPLSVCQVKITGIHSAVLSPRPHLTRPHPDPSLLMSQIEHCPREDGGQTRVAGKVNRDRPGLNHLHEDSSKTSIPTRSLLDLA